MPRVCRAFPLLGVDVQKQRKVVAFLREIGVVNVARFATRLPPVLAYDVDADLRPKMAHLAASALSVYDVVRFPAYFSYPLDTVILSPRARPSSSPTGCHWDAAEAQDALHARRRPVREARRRRSAGRVRRLQGRVHEGARRTRQPKPRRPPRGPSSSPSITSATGKATTLSPGAPDVAGGGDKRKQRRA